MVEGLAVAVGVTGSGLIFIDTKSVLIQVPKVAVTVKVAVPELTDPAVIEGFATVVELKFTPAQLLHDQLYDEPAGAVGAPPIIVDSPAQIGAIFPASTTRGPTETVISSVNIQGPFVTVTR